MNDLKTLTVLSKQYLANEAKKLFLEEREEAEPQEVTKQSIRNEICTTEAVLFSVNDSIELLSDNGAIREEAMQLAKAETVGPVYILSSRGYNEGYSSNYAYVENNHLVRVKDYFHALGYMQEAWMYKDEFSPDESMISDEKINEMIEEYRLDKDCREKAKDNTVIDYREYL